MARKTSLREFQQYLAERLKSAARGERGSSLLGIRAGHEDWLVDLADSGEIVQMPKLTHVPLTNKAFSGLANIRGNLYAVTDFSAFRGGELTPQNTNSRLLLIGSKHGSNAALLVTRMLGLKNLEDYTPEPADAEAPTWMAQRYKDNSGNVWRKLAVRELLTDEVFMNVGA